MDWFDISARARCNSDLFLILFTQGDLLQPGIWLRADYLTCRKRAYHWRNLSK